MRTSLLAIVLLLSVAARAADDYDLDVCDGMFKLKDLEVGVIRISNQDVSQILALVQTMGYRTVGHGYTERLSNDDYEEFQPPEFIAEDYGCEDLPVVVMPPPVEDKRLSFDSGDFLGLSGSSEDEYNEYGEDVGGDISPALHAITKPHTGETDHLLVFYHPSQLRTFTKLKELVNGSLDLRASQIYIEGLVLEVSEDGLRELGVEYQRIDPDNDRSYRIGTTNASPVSAGGTQVIDFVRDTLTDPWENPRQTLMKIQALVSSGTAEVLSRPSVLTLSNRQATIQIIDIVQFPIQEATITGSGEIVQSAFTFEAVRPGITLNLRPRVSEDREYVSLEIDVTVEALVSANNGEVRNDFGEVVATKPGTSARRVQTFAQIPDRTPIIIGGLISTDNEMVENRIPLLGSIPVLGRLFGGSKRQQAKREVIIVLTPYVVGAESRFADVSIPKDTSLFDVDDAKLFRSTYRVRSEDVYDLRFLIDNPEFTERRQRAVEAIATRPELLEQPILRNFAEGRVPGGDKFLNRMIFDLVRRRELGKNIDSDALILLSETTTGNPHVEMVKDLYQSVKSEPDDAFVLVLSNNAESAVVSRQRVGNSAWSEKIWQLSYGAEGNAEQYAIVVRNKQDLEILVDSVITSSIISQNGGYDQLSVDRFKQGAILSLPNFDENRFYLVDDKVARVFTDIQHYYRAGAQALEDSYSEMDKAIMTLDQGEADF